MTEGEWISPSANEEAVYAGLAAREALYAAEPRFDGVVAGIQIGPGPVADDPNCPEATELTDVPDQPFPLRLGYLPPNTFETHEVQFTADKEGRLLAASRRFHIGQEKSAYDAAFRVTLWGCGQGVQTDVPESLVGEIKINDLTAAAIRPVTAEGYYSSRILVPMGEATAHIEVWAALMPFDEVLKIAEGISCEEHCW